MEGLRTVFALPPTLFFFSPSLEGSFRPTDIMKDTAGSKHKKTYNRTKLYNDTCQQQHEEYCFIQTLSPYYSRALLDKRKDDFLTQAFHVWLDRFPLVIAPDDDADYIQWLRDKEKKVPLTINFWVGYYYADKPATAWEDRITISADREQR
ncbi:hypothetical protein BDZ94DRAFT_1242420, partial [Collybia nuda]